MALRQFLYFDSSLVDDFLAQLEGGQTDEVRRREQRQRGGKGDIGVGVGPISASGGLSRGSTEETEGVIRQVRASRFQRLHDLLDEAGELTEIEDDLDAQWDQIRRGALLELDVHVAVPKMARVFSGPAGLTSLASLMRLVSPESIDPETETAIAGITALAQTSGEGSLTVVASAPSSIYRFVIRLNRKYIVGGIELEGEAVVLGKVARKLREQDREIIIDLPGLSVLDAETRRSMSGPEAEEFTVQGPGAIFVPVAIFR